MLKIKIHAGDWNFYGQSRCLWVIQMSVGDPDLCGMVSVQFVVCLEWRFSGSCCWPLPPSRSPMLRKLSRSWRQLYNKWTVWSYFTHSLPLSLPPSVPDSLPPSLIPSLHPYLPPSLPPSTPTSFPFQGVVLSFSGYMKRVWLCRCCNLSGQIDALALSLRLNKSQ